MLVKKEQHMPKRTAWEWLPFDDYAKRLPRNSGGEQQRVGLSGRCWTDDTPGGRTFQLLDATSRKQLQELTRHYTMSLRWLIHFRYDDTDEALNWRTVLLFQSGETASAAYLNFLWRILQPHFCSGTLCSSWIIPITTFSRPLEIELVKARVTFTTFQHCWL